MKFFKINAVLLRKSVERPYGKKNEFVIMVKGKLFKVFYCAFPT